MAREHRPSRILPCEQCGKLRRRYYGGVDAKKKRHFCGRSCTALANTTAVERRCEQCGEPFTAIKSDVEAGKARFHSPECAHQWAREHPQNERMVELGGVSFPLRVLAEASGATKAALAYRIDTGMSPLDAMAAGPRKASPKRNGQGKRRLAG